MTRTLRAIQVFAIVVNGVAAGFDSFLATMPKQPLASRIGLAFLAGVCATLFVDNIRRFIRGIRHDSDARASVQAARDALAAFPASAAYFAGPFSFPRGTGHFPTGAGPRPSVVETVEDYAIGYRSWYVSEGRLLPITQIGVWEPGWNHSTCRYFDHAAPQWECQCGFYARLAPAAAPLGTIAGAIQARKRIIEHGTEGFRAEEARIVALTMPAWEEPSVYSIDYFGLSRRPSLSEITEVARRYEVPVLSSCDQLRSHAQEFGREVHA